MFLVFILSFCQQFPQFATSKEKSLSIMADRPWPYQRGLPLIIFGSRQCFLMTSSSTQSREEDGDDEHWKMPMEKTLWEREGGEKKQAFITAIYSRLEVGFFLTRWKKEGGWYWRQGMGSGHGRLGSRVKTRSITFLCCWMLCVVLRKALRKLWIPCRGAYLRQVYILLAWL
jgi:hypothetical protein